MLADSEIMIRFFVSTLAGLMIGYARRHKPAGMRTFALFSLGCTIFTVVSINTMMAGVDPTRIIAQIVTGIGFLGLGVIWKQGIGKPTGLTTAASIWVTAAIGILIGMGMWTEVAAGTILTLVILFSKRVLLVVGLEKE